MGDYLFYYLGFMSFFGLSMYILALKLPPGWVDMKKVLIKISYLIPTFFSLVAIIFEYLVT